MREGMQKAVARRVEADPDLLSEKLLIEKELLPGEKNIGFAESLKLLEPFGEANPVPLFCILNARLGGVRTMGAEEQHVRFVATAPDGIPVNCVLFGRAADYKDIIFGSDRIDVAGELDINEFRGERRLQMRVRDIRAAEEGN